MTQLPKIKDGECVWLPLPETKLMLFVTNCKNTNEGSYFATRSIFLTQCNKSVTISSDDMCLQNVFDLCVLCNWCDILGTR